MAEENQEESTATASDAGSEFESGRTVRSKEDGHESASFAKGWSCSLRQDAEEP
jgi:hypothetical protein